MSKNQGKRRGNGTGSIKFYKGKPKPYMALVSKGKILDRNGKTVIKYKSIGSFKTRQEAENALIIYDRTPLDLSSKIKTFEDLYKVWSASYFTKISSSAVRCVNSAYSYCFDIYTMDIVNIAPGHIKDLMDSAFIIDKNGKKKMASKCTQERIKSMCNLMFDYALERNLVLYNPSRAFKITHLIKEIEEEKKVKEPFCCKDIQKMWKYVDVTPFTDMVLIGIYTGFRPQELAILEIDNINLEEGSIIGGMKTSNGKNRKVPIHPDIMPLVEKRYYEAVDLLGSDRLFNDPRSQTGCRMTYDKYRRKFEFVMADLALNGFSPHCTRHTFATQAKRCGMEPGIMKRILGHSLKSDVTEYYYTHPEFSDFENEIRKLRFK